VAEKQGIDLAELGLTAEQAYKLGLLTAEFTARAVAVAEQRVWARAGDVARGIASRLRARADEKTDPVDRKHWRAMSAGASSVALKLVEVSDSAGLVAPGTAPNPSEVDRA
jgi:hypothetical protein